MAPFPVGRRSGRVARAASPGFAFRARTLSWRRPGRQPPAGGPSGQRMRTDVLVIGGGLAGCATAYYLAREGVEVALLERHDLNAQASGSNAGSIHAQIPHEPFRLNGEAWAHTFAPTIPLMVESIRLWSTLGEELGADLEVSLPGGLLVAETDTQMHEIECKAVIERAAGLPIEILGRAELRALAPYVAEGMIGGAFCPVEGKAN